MLRILTFVFSCLFVQLAYAASPDDALAKAFDRQARQSCASVQESSGLAECMVAVFQEKTSSSGSSRIVRNPFMDLILRSATRPDYTATCEDYQNGLRDTTNTFLKIKKIKIDVKKYDCAKLSEVITSITGQPPEYATCPLEGYSYAIFESCVSPMISELQGTRSPSHLYEVLTKLLAVEAQNLKIEKVPDELAVLKNYNPDSEISYLKNEVISSISSCKSQGNYESIRIVPKFVHLRLPQSKQTDFNMQKEGSKVTCADLAMLYVKTGLVQKSEVSAEIFKNISGLSAQEEAAHTGSSITTMFPNYADAWTNPKILSQLSVNFSSFSGREISMDCIIQMDDQKYGSCSVPKLHYTFGVDLSDIPAQTKSVIASACDRYAHNEASCRYAINGVVKPSRNGDDIQVKNLAQSVADKGNEFCGLSDSSACNPPKLP
jgi:hypothetical protein